MDEYKKHKILCDNCKAEIEPNIKTKVVNDLEITYFECEECLAEYTVCVTDGEIRKQQEKLNIIEHKIKALYEKRKQEIKDMQSKYGTQYKQAKKQKVKNRINKEYRKEISSSAKIFSPKYQALLDEREKVKKMIFSKAEVLKKMYELK